MKLSLTVLYSRDVLAEGKSAFWKDLYYFFSMFPRCSGKIFMSTLSLTVCVIHIQTRDFRAKWFIYEKMARKGSDTGIYWLIFFLWFPSVRSTLCFLVSYARSHSANYLVNLPYCCVLFYNAVVASWVSCNGVTGENLIFSNVFKFLLQNVD